MTEKRFKLGYVCGDYGLIDNGDWIDLHSMSVNSEKNVQICINKMNELAEENKQLRKDATILIYANQDYMQQNINLQKQLDYIQNLISNAIKHQKTELGQKALQEIIADYNEWMLGHKEAKE